MIMTDIEIFLKQFRKLRRDHKFGGAPHKPILLLAIFSLIRKEVITSSRIEITAELLLEFKEYWSKLVTTPHVSNFALPFFHMRSEPFWKLVTKSGAVIPVTKSHSIRSFRALNETILYAELDRGLFALLSDKATNYYLSEQVLDYYFKSRNPRDLEVGHTLFSSIEMEILKEDKVQYQSKIRELEQSLTKDKFDEELFVRCGIFKREIPKIYNYTCAISGLRIDAMNNIQMVDACHIIPFATSHDDTIGNGICLSPNLHRAFDRGLITVTDKFSVRVSPRIIEAETPFMLKQFDGTRIILPEKSAFRPSVTNFMWHNKEVFIE